MLPLLICAQEMSTRIAIVTNQGLATVIRRRSMTLAALLAGYTFFLPAR
jgi:Mn2+/Fe2+ NRAMP family transporter